MKDPDDAPESTDGRVERAKDRALGKHDSNPSHLDEAGEGVGAIGGVVAGAAIGMAGGPIGAIVGGLAGAVGGWWAGRAVTEAASSLSASDDEYYRGHYNQAPHRYADRSYDDVRPAYMLGHIAARNPDYARKHWDDVAPELARGWSVENARKYGDWASVSRFASEGYNRGMASHGNEGQFDRIVPSEERR